MYRERVPECERYALEQRYTRAFSDAANVFPRAFTCFPYYLTSPELRIQLRNL